MNTHIESPAPSTPADFELSAADGLRLAARSWHAREPKGVVVVSHGFGEHGRCYRAIAERLSSEACVDVLSFDYRGHGRSEGKRGVVGKYEDLLLDLDAAIDRARADRPGLPLYILGHSNGALVTLRRVVRDPSGLAGVVVSNPTLRIRAKVPRWKVLLAEVLLRVAPSITLASDLPHDMLTSDPEMLGRISADPLRIDRISPHYYFGMVAAGPMLREAAPSIRTPMLVLLGEDDPLVDPTCGRDFFDRLGSADKTLEGYPGMRHEPLNERGRERVEEDIVRWVGERLEGGQRSAFSGQPDIGATPSGADR